LSACVYGDGGHFVGIGKDFMTGKLYYCDGMKDNAQMIEQPFTLFPAGGIKGNPNMQLTTAFFI
jgi:hypothetical protein